MSTREKARSLIEKIVAGDQLGQTRSLMGKKESTGSR
jgi:hypothetical protein